MMAQPKSYKSTILIQDVREDPSTPGKYFISGKIDNAEEGAKDNTFYAPGRSIEGFTFNLPGDIKPGTLVKADMEFMGDPFKQNYQLNNIELVN